MTKAVASSSRLLLVTRNIILEPRALISSMKPENMETPQQESVHGTPAELGTAPKPVEKEASKSSTLDDQISFLNSLPEIKKPDPKPKQNGFDEHLAFLSSLPRIDAQQESPKPAPQPGAEEIANPASVESVPSPDVDVSPAPVVQEKQIPQPAKQPPKKKPARQGKTKKSASQLQREEKNRLEKEKAEAKKAEIRKRQQEAEQKKDSSTPRDKAKSNKTAAKKKSLLGRFLKG